MLGRLFLLFTVTTALELWLLIRIGALVGVWPTLALILFTGFVGAWLTRREGLRTIRRVSRQLAEGKLPGDALLDGLCILIAGAFLVTPGILSDTAGFALLLPPVRAPIKRALVRSFQRAVAEGRATGRFTFVQAGPGGASIVDVASAPPPRDGAPERPTARPLPRTDVIDV